MKMNPSLLSYSKKKQWLSAFLPLPPFLTRLNHVYFLHCRTAEEYAAGHAPSAVNVPVVFLGGKGMSPNPAFLAEAERIFPSKEESLVVVRRDIQGYGSEALRV